MGKGGNMSDIAVGTRRQYAEQSLKWDAAAEKSDDELLQRIWNLAEDSLHVIAALTAAEAERDRANVEWHRIRALHGAAIKDLRAVVAERDEWKHAAGAEAELFDLAQERTKAAEAERDEAQARLSSIGGYEGYDDALERLRKQRNQLLIGSLETTVALLDAEVIFPADFSPELRQRLARAMKGDTE